MHTGAVKDSVVGDERLAQYLLAILNTRKTPLHWERLNKEQTAESLSESKGSHGNPLKESIPNKRRRVNDSDVVYIQDLVKEVQRTLYVSFSEFDGNLEEENDIESLIDTQLTMLRKPFRIQQKASESGEARTKVSKKLLTLFRMGKLGPFVLDNLPTDSIPKSEHLI